MQSESYTVIVLYVLQTLDALHSRAKTAHLDLSSNNIMLSHKVSNPWGRVQLIDFGSSRLCTAGNSNHPNCQLCCLLTAYYTLHHLQLSRGVRCWFLGAANEAAQLKTVLGLGIAGKKDVLPRTITPDYAAPELVRSCVNQTNKTIGMERVNGPAADVWSSAVVLYLMLTGQLPFAFEQLANPKLPAGGRAEGRSAALLTLAHCYSIAHEHIGWESSPDACPCLPAQRPYPTPGPPLRSGSAATSFTTCTTTVCMLLARIWN